MSQNQLLIANTIVTVLAASIAFGSFIAGLFGMNLDNNEKYQSYDGSFVAVTLLTIALVALIAVFTIYYFQQTAMLPSEIVLDTQAYRKNFTRLHHRHSQADTPMCRKSPRSYQNGSDFQSNYSAGNFFTDDDHI